MADGDINALFPISVGFSGTLSNVYANALFPISVGFSGTVSTTQPVVATLAADIFTAPITTELYRGAVGACSLDISISGTGRGALIAHGNLSDIELAISGSGRSGQASGRGNLSVQIILAGQARTSFVTIPTKVLAIDISLSGRGHGRVRGTGSLAFDDFTIEGTGYLVPHGSGSLALGISLDASAHIYIFDTDSGTFVEAFRCLVLNVKNFALTEYDFTFNSLVSFNGVNLGAHGTALYELTGDSDAGANIPWYFQTGKIDTEKSNVNRLRYVWLSYRPSGDLTLIVNDGLNEYEYPVIAYDADDNTVKVKIGKGIKEKYVQLKLKNIDRQSIFLDRMRLFTESVAKRR